MPVEHGQTPMMSESAISDDFLSAAGVCVWEWNAERAKIRLQHRGDAGHLELNGDWSLPGFQTQFDGLSANALAEIFKTIQLGRRIDSVLTLASGEQVRLLGNALETGIARGLLFGVHDFAPVEDNSELEAVYQPIIDLGSEHIVGFEALARWRGDDGHLRSAADLDSQQQQLLDHTLAISMLDQASATLSEWYATFPERSLFIQVNLTGADLFRADVLQKIRDVAASDVFPASALKLELTEQMALQDFSAGVAAAQALAASGVGLLLDDFGSGYSSFAWLAAMPATGLKLDPHLIQMSGQDRTKLVLESVVELAAKLNMTVTAEGIETDVQLRALKLAGCDYGQGYFFAKPLEKREATEQIQKSSP